MKNQWKVKETSIKGYSILSNGDFRVFGAVSVQLPTETANLFSVAEEMFQLMEVISTLNPDEGLSPGALFQIVEISKVYCKKAKGGTV